MLAISLRSRYSSVVHVFVPPGPGSVQSLLRSLQRCGFINSIAATLTTITSKAPLAAAASSKEKAAAASQKNGTESFAQLTPNDWWDEFGKMKALHSMNELRVPWIRDTLVRRRNTLLGSCEELLPHKPLHGFRILDVGCGAGVLAEPLARLGANVTAIDSLRENIAIAKQHMNLVDPTLADRLKYEVASYEELGSIEGAGKFHAVVASEVIEHVSDKAAFVDACVAAVSPASGQLLFTTINRTLASKALAIWAAEDILGLLPSGMHSWDQFLEPQDLRIMLEWRDCNVRMLNGIAYNPLRNRWSWLCSTAVNYALHAERKPI